MPEYDSMDELRADCAQLPHTLGPREPVLPAPRATVSWTVDDDCLATVDGLDEYV